MASASGKARVAKSPRVEVLMPSLEELDTALRQSVKTDWSDEGWFTKSRYAEQWGVSDTTATRKLIRAVSRGLMEKKTLPALRDGYPYPTPHYRWKGKNSSSVRAR